MERKNVTEMVNPFIKTVDYNTSRMEKDEIEGLEDYTTIQRIII